MVFTIPVLNSYPRNPWLLISCLLLLLNELSLIHTQTDKWTDKYLLLIYLESMMPGLGGLSVSPVPPPVRGNRAVRLIQWFTKISKFL